jgi:adenine-specific DNA-methyltransferase
MYISFLKVVRFVFPIIQSALKLLCDDIFGLNNFINQIALKTKASAGASGGGEDKRLKKNTEYMLWYARNKAELFFEKPKNKIKLSDYIKEHKENKIGFYYTRVITDYGKKEFVGSIKAGNGDDIKIYKHSNFEFSSVSKLSKELNCSEDEIYKKYYNNIFMVTNAQTSILPKVNSFIGEKNCLVSYEYIPTTGKSKGQLETKLIWNETLVVWLKDSTIFIDGEIYKTEILGTLWGNISWGRLDLEGYVSFKNGKKPLSLLNQIMEFTVTKNSTILDFFAGSGTTGHAVMKLNAEDGGHRKFILCTNNENNICRDVTYERIKRVIEKENYKASLKYFKVDFVPISEKLYYEYADELLKHVKELVELENAINFDGNDEIAIILTEEELDKFTKKIPKTCKTIYLGHDVLPSETQEKLFKKNGITLNIIPNYYYSDLEG